jgi:hypothetical protein
MFMSALLQRLGRGLRTGTRARPSAPVRRFRPCVRELETRRLMTSLTVVLATDAGGPTGQKVSATTGDLRYCIEQADASHSATTDTIRFSSTLFATPQTITLNSATGPLVLSDSHPLTIKGPIANTVTVSGGDAIEVLTIASGTVSISNLAISHGNAVSNTSTSGQGGGIFDSGQLTLTNCTLDHDVAGPSAGGLYVNLNSSATIIGSTFDHDTAAQTTPVVDGEGGAIFDAGTLKVTNSTFSNCVAGGTGGGAIFVEATDTATLTNCTLSNDSGEDGGGIFVDSGSTLTLTKVILSNDSAGNAGGGICTDGTATVTVQQSTFSDDTSGVGSGGGIANVQGSTITVSQSTFSNDSHSGVLNQGTATITASTFSNDSGVSGGGLENQGTATVTNCTFSNDTATSTSSLDGGGAIINDNTIGGATLTVTNCTIANNAALNGSSGGGILNQTGGTLTLINTIVAQNTGTGSGPDVSGNVNTADHNLIGDGAGMTIGTDQGGNLIGGNGNPVIDPRLGPLQNNGGHTQTLALLRDSPAIGAGDNTQAPATDQRGVTRADESGETTDIGAFEL